MAPVCTQEFTDLGAWCSSPQPKYVPTHASHVVSAHSLGMNILVDISVLTSSTIDGHHGRPPPVPRRTLRIDCPTLTRHRRSISKPSVSLLRSEVSVALNTDNEVWPNLKYTTGLCWARPGRTANVRLRFSCPLSWATLNLIYSQRTINSRKPYPCDWWIIPHLTE